MLAVAAMMFVACTTEKEIPYLTNIDDIPTAALASVTSQAGDFTIKPGEVVETRVNNAGVYIVQSTDGEYTKKLAVR